ncbi:protein of unknown function, DUF490-containing [Citrifermentans bemidjiense Bem]|uniref:Translocation and assembly module TamB C-terminal domain-containing protein n=1 Tax=Citrifermentans bemidjiense (strain ATCC BAA-1014 / DSM 16622 / JCM 12645 / Bem) TaxID=404380 RepID=B5E9K2_CITBB|nr:translocation/assembly module TamB [Citrifermentans bemidjiense]ACH40176.1 protein of unknown function, DUF490-containing [Citrifermentans bemidjiense Bem]
MKRIALYLGGAILALALVVFAGLVWLVDTSSGARFALTTLDSFAGVEVTVQKVEGRLRDRLLLQGVTVSRPRMLVRVEKLRLVWDPERLLGGKLLVHELALRGVRIEDDTPLSEKAPELRWPRVSGAARSIDAEVTRFSLKELSYRHLQQPPSELKELAASLALKEGTLTLTGGSISASRGTASGELAAGLWRPSLSLDLRLSPSAAVADMDAFSVQARLMPGTLPEQMAGPLVLSGRRGGAPRLELTSELGITSTGFNLRNLKLVRPGRRGTLSGSGSMTLTKTEPVLNLALRAAELDLSKELNTPDLISGTLNFSGTPSNYLGNFSLANQGKGWRKATLAAGYRGGKSGVKLAPLSGQWLGGGVRGALDIGWEKGVLVSGKLAGRRLDSSQLAASWKGVVNLDLTGSVDVPEQGEVRGSLDAHLLQSRLQGHELRGDLQGSFLGKTMLVKRLVLAGKGFSARGSGQLDRRFDFAADVSDLSGAVPAASGELRAGGWFRWRDGVLSGAVSGNGRNIAASGGRVGSLEVKASLGEEKGYPVHLDAALKEVSLGKAQVETAHLSLAGTLARHQLEGRLASGENHAELSIEGGYAGGEWRGRLLRFSGADSVGPFALAAPATVVAGGGRFALSPLILVGAQGERVELAGNLERDKTGSLRASWSALNLSRANYWLSGGELNGKSSGEVEVAFLRRRRIDVSGHAEADGGMVIDGQHLDLERFQATINGGAGGLTALADLALKEGAGAARLDLHSSDPASLSLPNRGDLAIALSGVDLALLRPFLPSGMLVDGKMRGDVTGNLLPGGRVDVKGEGSVSEGHLNWLSQGEEFDALLDQAKIGFGWRGRINPAKGRRAELTLSARAAATGTYTSNGERMLVAKSTLRLDADNTGSRAAVDLTLDQGGSLTATFFSNSPAGFNIPETGDLSARWSGIRPELLKPWLPGTLDLKGELSGQANGRLMPGQRLELSGEAGFSQGRASWQGGNGVIGANLRSATLTFAWRGETLTGNLALALADYGQAQGNILLPIPARLPVAQDPRGAVRGSFAGKVKESGFLTSLFPGLVQETHGALDLDLTLSGTWGDPALVGSLRLADAGAYLPSAGIRLTGVELSALLTHNQIRIERLRARSGEGELVGNLLVQLNGREIAGYTGTLSGQGFQTVYLPELRMTTSPQLTFKGEGDRVTLQGEIGVPEMLILGSPAHQAETASSDVILEGAPAESARKPFPLVLDGRVKVVLGDKVRVEASGIDARLVGDMDLVLKGIDNIESSGEIRVVQGRYRAYGMDLEIVRGRIYYVNDPVNRPTLDILALRTVGDVKAGVTVGGFLNTPVVKLYSEPPMPEVDILAYMVLGHPLGASGEQGALLATAAASLFSFGKSESVQEQVKDRLGLSTLGLETVDTSKAGRMGYKEISTTPGGAAAAEPAGGQSLFTVGKYLTPELYLSYGRSLITGENLFRLRYDIYRRWQIETQSGSESGADLYYKLEFD